VTKRTRAAALTTALLAAAAIGVVRLTLSPHLLETCADRQALFDPDQLGMETAGIAITGGPRHRAMDGYLVSSRAGGALAFTIRRTFQLPNWLIRPTTAIPGPKEPDRFETRELDVDGTTIQARFAYAMHRGGERFAVYTLAYDGEATLSAFWLRVFEAPLAVVHGIRPITYIGVASASNRVLLAEQERRAIEFIETAWRHYQRSCRP
jgi:hypothetical protein